MTFGLSTTWSRRGSKCSRSSPKRRQRYGSPSSEVQRGGGSAVRGEGRSLAGSPGGGGAGGCHSGAWGGDGVLIGFESEDEWLEYRLETDPRFLARVDQARASLRPGHGLRLEDVPEE